MTSKYVHVKQWRRKVKTLLVAAFGGCCGICGYDRCIEGLEFHHLDPNEKELSISSWRDVASFDGLANEAEKCVMLCALCHREVHAGVTVIPEDIQRFSRDAYRASRSEADSQRRIEIGVRKEGVRKAQVLNARKRVDWSSTDVLDRRRKGETWISIATSMGVSIEAVRKRFEKISGTSSNG